ncbi:HlyC/CorC family transporter [Anaeromassilibacillus sp. An172]|uniref:HlyC/CorC family transporter n=1 Tax=Anaeromassilibacillus sp. An172 TaxID=1965570 RepID=UPI001FA8D155|nr:hemolysin family protein [Anaeromassilibacillus sp. An172]
MNENAIMGIVIFICILFSAFFSGTETAFSTVNQVRLKSYADSGSKKAKRAKTALYICDNYDKTITTILIGNNIVNLGGSSLATVLCMNIWGDMGAAIATGATTFLVLTFGEIIPKCIGKESSETIALYTAGILRVFMFVLYPIALFFIGLKSIVIKMLRIKNDAPSVTEDELKYIINSIEEEGVLEQQEKELVQSALDFDEKTAFEILTPRVDMTAVDIDSDYETMKKTILEERFSRIPVYQGNYDNIIGIIHSRDFLEEMAMSVKPNIKKLIQPAQFVYKNQRLSDILTEFRKNKHHMAIVIDEYGGTLGLITMEDLLEEIVGEIWDEDEEEEKLFTKIEDGTYKVSGDMPLEEVFGLFGVSTRNLDTDSITIGGFFLDKKGEIPKAGDSLEIDDLKITVMEIEDQRIITLLVGYSDKEEPAEEQK